MIKIERLSPDAQATFQREGREFPAQMGQLLTQDEFATLVITAGEIMVSINESEIQYHTVESIHPRPQLLDAAEIAVDVVYTEEFKAAHPVEAPAPAVPVDEISQPIPEPTPAEPVIVFPAKTA